MKKSVIVIYFLILGIFFVSPVFVFASFDKNLYYGIRGSSDVQELQEFLTDQGVYTGPITGNFFSLTLKAVKAFQTRESISPVSGFFGPLSRGKANDLLAANIGSLTDESGTPISPATTTPSTTDDVVAKLNEQNRILQEQNNLLQSQTATLGQIQQNTTPKPNPPPTPLPPPPPEIKKELKIFIYNCAGSTRCQIDVYYYEKGEKTDITGITIKSDYPDEISGTGETVKSGYDGKPVAYFYYHAIDDGRIIDETTTANRTRTITATVNGLTASKQVICSKSGGPLHCTPL